MGYPLGLGTTLSWAATAIGQIVSLTPHSGEMGQVDTSDLDSTVRTFKPTILDPGEVSITITYDDAVTIHATLETAYLAKTIAALVATFTNTGATTWSCSAFIRRWQFLEHTIENLSQVTITFKLTSTITITP